MRISSKLKIIQLRESIVNTSAIVIISISYLLYFIYQIQMEATSQQYPQSFQQIFQDKYVIDTLIQNQNKYRYIKKLRLTNNKIQQTDKLSLINLQRLQYLYLGTNLIKNIQFLLSMNLTNLKQLYLGYNQIENISVFSKIHFVQIQQCSLRGNNISDIEPLSKCNLSTLKILYIDHNYIIDVGCLDKIQFAKDFHLIMSKSKKGEQINIQANDFFKYNLKMGRKVY